MGQEIKCWYIQQKFAPGRQEKRGIYQDTWHIMETNQGWDASCNTVYQQDGCCVN